MIAEAGLVLQRRGRARRFALGFAGFGIHATSGRRVRHTPGNWYRSQLISAFPGHGASSLEWFQVAALKSVHPPALDSFTAAGTRRGIPRSAKVDDQGGSPCIARI